MEIKLLPHAPEGLIILPESKWTEYDRRIWKGSEAMLDAVLSNAGISSLPYPQGIGRYDGLPSHLVRFYGDEGGRELNGYCSFSTFNRNFLVQTSVFVCPRNLIPGESPFYNGIPFEEKTILCGDGTYDVLAQKIPSGFIDQIIDHMFPEDWKDHFDESDGNALLDYIEEEVGSINCVVDPIIRSHLEKLISNYP